AEGRKFKVFPEFIDALQKHDFPGNIRELENILRRAIVLAENNQITLASLPSNFKQNTSISTESLVSDSEKNYSLEEVEKHTIMGALERTGGNRSKAAKLLKVPRHVLLYRLKKFGLE
ncbi:MAG: sigma-54-dependent Fis family transcriptional regulator, partial [Nitrosopumilaceae archaeon]|nr:sigma-54-dependent Fis family transcriptional regulator [Nitrosopumilaceae archaeon]NIU85969.1 sigma-54-dependent Fis family transcriptional regulator [Nitrosopumilaceae archaeon]NIX60183.1 sigma-54-dependent Fis family transcriptional regulator [Nitrosopumilaceae archaeon]